MIPTLPINIKFHGNGSMLCPFTMHQNPPAYFQMEWLWNCFTQFLVHPCPCIKYLSALGRLQRQWLWEMGASYVSSGRNFNGWRKAHYWPKRSKLSCVYSVLHHSVPHLRFAGCRSAGGWMKECSVPYTNITHLDEHKCLSKIPPTQAFCLW